MLGYVNSICSMASCGFCAVFDAALCGLDQYHLLERLPQEREQGRLSAPALVLVLVCWDTGQGLTESSNESGIASKGHFIQVPCLHATLLNHQF